MVKTFAAALVAVAVLSFAAAMPAEDAPPPGLEPYGMAAPVPVPKLEPYGMPAPVVPVVPGAPALEPYGMPSPAVPEPYGTPAPLEPYGMPAPPMVVPTVPAVPAVPTVPATPTPVPMPVPVPTPNVECTVGGPLAPAVEAFRPFTQNHDAPYHQGDLLHHSVWTATAAENYLVRASGEDPVASSNPAAGLDVNDPRTVRLLTLAAFLHDAGKGGMSASSGVIPKSVRVAPHNNPKHVARGFRVLAPTTTNGGVRVEQQPFLLSPSAAARVRALCRECVVKAANGATNLFSFDAFYAHVNRHFSAIDRAALPERHARRGDVTFRRPLTIDAEAAKHIAILSAMHYETGNLGIALQRDGARGLHVAVDVFFARLSALVDDLGFARGVTSSLLREIILIGVADVTGNVPVPRASTSSEYLLQSGDVCPAPSTTAVWRSKSQSGYDRWQYEKKIATLRAAVLDGYYSASEVVDIADGVRTRSSGVALSDANIDVMVSARRVSATAAAAARGQLEQLIDGLKFEDLKKTNEKLFKLSAKQKLNALLARIRRSPLLARFRPDAPLYEPVVTADGAGPCLIDSIIVTVDGQPASVSASVSVPLRHVPYQNQYEIGYRDVDVPLHERRVTEETVFGYPTLQGFTPRRRCASSSCAERPKYFALDLFGSSSGEAGSAAFTVSDAAPLRAAATVTHRPVHSLLRDRASRVVVTADLVGGETRPYFPGGHRESADDFGAVEDSDGDGVHRTSVGTFDGGLEHVLLSYLTSSLTTDAQRDAFVSDLLECNAQSCTAKRSRNACGADVEHVWEVQVHAARVPWSVLNGVRSDWRAPALSSKKPKAAPKKETKEQKEKREREEKKRADEQKKRDDEAKKRAADAKKKAEERDKKLRAAHDKWTEQQKKEYDELQVIGRRGRNGPMGRLAPEPPLPPSKPVFGSETGAKLRRVATRNAWPLAWTAAAGTDGRARVILDVSTEMTRDGVGFDSRCRFVRSSEANSSAYRAPTAAVLADAWDAASSASASASAVPVTSWDAVWERVRDTEYVC